jgi:hypothetical protein
MSWLPVSFLSFPLFDLEAHTIISKMYDYREWGLTIIIDNQTIIMIINRTNRFIIIIPFITIKIFSLSSMARADCQSSLLLLLCKK